MPGISMIAVSVTIDPKTRHWVLTVHIADVGAFVKAGGALDVEARNGRQAFICHRRVLPMFPEVISNGLASLQEGKLRYVKTVQMEFTPGLQKGHVRFANGAIRNRKRFTYEQVQEILDTLDDVPNIPGEDREHPEKPASTSPTNQPSTLGPRDHRLNSTDARSGTSSPQKAIEERFPRTEYAGSGVGVRRSRPREWGTFREARLEPPNY